jgi:hypothetical protein
LSTPIAEDFAAIRARLLAIRAAERPWVVAPASPPQTETEQDMAGDFYFWLMGGKLWASG